MENQINIGNQNSQKIGQNPINQQIEIQAKSKFNYWIVSTIIFFVLFSVMVVAYVLTLKKVEKSQYFPTSTEQPANIIPTSSVDEKKYPQEEETYQNSQLKISFSYPSGWIVKEENDISTMDMCDLGSIDPNRYPKASVKYGACEASGITPTASIKFARVLGIRPKSSLQESYYQNPAIQLSYYGNKENFSIQEFNDKYLSETVAGDPVSIWAPTYEKVTNPNKLVAYYDKEHYCVAVCQVYVWSHANKIFILKNFPTNAVNQDKIFSQVFNSFRVLE